MHRAVNRRTSTPAPRIEEYGIIGDLQTAALVSRDGSIDWLCLPDFASAACFAKLLGDERHGYWRIAPAGAPESVTAVRRSYREGTLVLETEMDTADGTIRVIDCMPTRKQFPVLIRLVQGMRGRVPIRMELKLRFDYGDAMPWVTRSGRQLIAISGPNAVALDTRAETHGEDFTTVAEMMVGEGQGIPFQLTWFPSNQGPPSPADAWYAIETTSDWWQQWSSACAYLGPYRAAVIRSLVTLKALTHEPTGGIVAAPTTSLPEALGGVRNWDYRYCWIRDATLTLEALMLGGYHAEALSWRDWLLRAAAGDVSKLQIMYGAYGDRRLDEWTVNWLPGYEGSSPVRIGNAASRQFQLDVYGEVMSALHEASKSEGMISAAQWDFQRALMDYLEDGWRQPDEGIWEVRAERRHFTHSKVMAWVAVDRAVRTLEHVPELEGPIGSWRALRHDIHREVLERGFNSEKNAFTQSYGSGALDASLLRVPLVGFLPARDPRVTGTIEAIERELMDGGFVRRYLTSGSGEVDGLPGDEGAFLPCSFWLVDCLHMSGRSEDAVCLFEQLLAVRNDLGLLSEEYDTGAERLVGNFPQAFSHVSLINSAFLLLSAAHRPVPKQQATQRRAASDGERQRLQPSGRTHARVHGWHAGPAPRPSTDGRARARTLP